MHIPLHMLRRKAQRHCSTNCWISIKCQKKGFLLWCKKQPISNPGYKQIYWTSELSIKSLWVHKKEDSSEITEKSSFLLIGGQWSNQIIMHLIDLMTNSKNDFWTQSNVLSKKARSTQWFHLFKRFQKLNRILNLWNLLNPAARQLLNFLH